MCAQYPQSAFSYAALQVYDAAVAAWQSLRVCLTQVRTAWLMWLVLHACVVAALFCIAFVDLYGC